jgi:uncharacterized cupin superfamily protein
MLEGEVVLVTNAGEETLGAGMVAGFRAGDGNAHHLINRSDAPAVYLEISNRDANDSATYPDVDLAYRRGPDGAPTFWRKDGAPYRKP